MTDDSNKEMFRFNVEARMAILQSNVDRVMQYLMVSSKQIESYQELGRRAATGDLSAFAQIVQDIVEKERVFAGMVKAIDDAKASK